MTDNLKAGLLERFSTAVTSLMGSVGEKTRDQLLTQIAKQAAELLDAEACAVFLVERNGFLTLVSEYGHLNEKMSGDLRELPITNNPSDSFCGYAAHQGEVFRAHGVQLDAQRTQPEAIYLRTPSGEDHSLLCVPLRKSTGELIGLLRLVNKKGAESEVLRDTGFVDEDARLAQAFAGTAALAIENLRQVEKIEKVRRAAQVVTQMTALGQSGQLLRSVVEATRDALRCDVITLYTFDAERDDFDYPPVMAGVIYEDQALAHGRVPEWSVVREVLKLSELYVATDTIHDELLGRAFAEREGIRSSVAIPLQAQGRPVGVMFVNYRDPRRFSEDELTAIDLFARQAAVAISNAQLYEQAQRRAGSLQMLYESSRAITNSLDLDEVLGRIAEYAMELATYRDKAASFADIRLVEGEKMRLTVARPREEQERIASALDESLEADVGIFGRAVRTNQAQRVNDVLEDPDYVRIHEQTRSQLIVPIKIGARVIGTLNVEHPKPNAFDEETVRMLEALSSQASIAIKNTRQYEELDRTKTLVSARTLLAWMGMASNVWGHSTSGYAVTINYNVELLRRYMTGDGGMNEPARQKSLELINRIDKMSRLILERPLMPPISRNQADALGLNDLMREYVERLRAIERYKVLEITLELHTNAQSRINVAPEWLRQAMDIIVDNAAQAMSDSPLKLVKIRTVTRNDAAEIYFQDTGHGIAPEILPKLMTAPIRDRATNSGMGVGLLMARTIVEAYDGTIWLEESSPRGATFGISFPQV